MSHRRRARAVGRTGFRWTGLAVLTLGTVVALIAFVPRGRDPEPAGTTAARRDYVSDPTSDPTSDPGSTEALYEPISGCAEGSTVPRGQDATAVGFEPLGSIWCFDLNEPPAPTAAQGANSWVDEFDVGGDVVMRFADGDLGYRVFDSAGAAPGMTRHFLNQNHWMLDARSSFQGGVSVRPDRAFGFEDGRFVLEADVAASYPDYGDLTWTELTITSAPAPTGEIADGLYAYGQFGGHWAVGCRLQPSRVPICAVMGPEPGTPTSSACQAIPGYYRVIETGFWIPCGDDTFGGGPWGNPGEHWRECDQGGPDMACRDRFRMEVTKDSIRLYVNGVLYFQDAGWPETNQLPDSFLDGDVYAYQSTWQSRGSDHAVRTHWDHFAVNPPTGPTASPHFDG